MREAEPGIALYDDAYTPEIVMARVGHLTPDAQRKVEFVTRIIRARFDPGTMIEPRPRISRIMLVPPESRPGKRPPDYEFWIILTDRMFTRQRLWRSVRREIRRALGDDCRMWLSFGSTGWWKRCKESDDEFFVERLAGGFTLYRASRDEPRRRRGRTAHACSRDSGRPL